MNVPNESPGSGLLDACVINRLQFERRAEAGAFRR